MARKPRVDRSPEEKWQIVQEGIKSGNVSETCRRHGIAPNLFYRWKDEAEQGAKAALGGRSAAAAETEKDHGIRQPERTLGRKSLEIEILKQFLGSRRLDMVLDYLSDPDEFRDFEMQRIERLPVGVVRPRKVKVSKSNWAIKFVESVIDVGTDSDAL